MINKLRTITLDYLKFGLSTVLLAALLALVLSFAVAHTNAMYAMISFWYAAMCLVRLYELRDRRGSLLAKITAALFPIEAVETFFFGYSRSRVRR